MTDETPEVPEEKPAEEKQPKKKATKKRASKKAAVAKAEPKAESERPAVSPPKGDGEPAPESGADSSGQDVATENPKVRRISSKPDSPKGDSKVEDSPRGNDDEQAPVISEPPGNDDQGSGGKRRRRRRRRGSGGDEGEAQDGQSPSNRPKLDPREVERKAWKIYLSEVSEEGLALINDNDARELSRRSFRIAELFLEEAARRQ
ncbi:hypothetical protein [Haloferula helveola]